MLPGMSVTLSSNISVSSHSSRLDEDLLNSFEYDEEQMTHGLFAKLEQVSSDQVLWQSTEK